MGRVVRCAPFLLLIICVSICHEPSLAYSELKLNNGLEKFKTSFGFSIALHYFCGIK